MTRVGEMTDAELRRELQRFNGGEKAAIVRAEQQRRRGVLPRPPPPTRAVDIVHEAINASGGLGEPWILDGVNAVRAGNLLLAIETDDVGWMATAYVIDGG